MDKGGRTKRISEEFQGLKRLGHDVKLVTFEEPPAWVTHQYDGSNEWIVLAKGTSKVAIGLLNRLFRLVREFQPDLIDAHCEGSAFYAGMVSRLLRVQCVATVHRSKLEYYTASWKMKLYYRFVHSAIAVSQQRRGLMSAALNIPDSRIEVVHWGIAVDSRDPHLDRDSMRGKLGVTADAVLVSVGHLGEIKGHDDSIAALSKLRARGRDVALYIAGDGAESDYTRLQQRAKDLGVEHSVTLLGQTGNVLEWLIACDIFLQPSREEAFGLVFLEAGLCNKPTVATHVGGIPEIIEHSVTGLLVDPESPDQIDKAIETLLADPGEAERLGAAARKRVVNEFSIDAKVRLLAEHFKDLVSSS